MYNLLIDTACIDSLYKMHIIEYKLEVIIKKSCKNTAAHSAEYIYSSCRAYLLYSPVKSLRVDFLKRSADTIHILRERVLKHSVVTDTVICDIDTLYRCKTVLYQRL